MSHFEHGAIDKSTRYLVDPASALKRTLYECPDCKRDVFVRKGNIKIPHFAHRKDKDNPCTYYNRNPTSEQRHKNAQLKLKQFLERRKEIHIGRRCACGCGWTTNWGITVSPDEIVKCEHRFKFNESNKSADVAVLTSSMNIGCIFEIVHKHYTRESDRPEPWHEISADEVNAIPSDIEHVVLTCIREKIRPECIKRQRLENEERLKRMSEREKERQLNEARYQEWVKKENERIRIILEKEEADREIRREKAEQVDRERRRIQEEEQRLFQEKCRFQIEDDEKRIQREKEEEERRMKEEEDRIKELPVIASSRLNSMSYEDRYTEISNRIPTCKKCNRYGRCSSCNNSIGELMRLSSS